MYRRRKARAMQVDKNGARHGVEVLVCLARRKKRARKHRHTCAGSRPLCCPCGCRACQMGVEEVCGSVACVVATHKGHQLALRLRRLALLRALHLFDLLFFFSRFSSFCSHRQVKRAQHATWIIGFVGKRRKTLRHTSSAVFQASEQGRRRENGATAAGWWKAQNMTGQLTVFWGGRNMKRSNFCNRCVLLVWHSSECDLKERTLAGSLHGRYELRSRRSGPVHAALGASQSPQQARCHFKHQPLWLRVQNQQQH